MRFLLNGEPKNTDKTALLDILQEFGFGEAKVATALNGDFVPAPLRSSTILADGDQLEVLAPMQGG